MEDDCYPQTIEVETYADLVSTYSPNLLSSGGLGPCIAIAFYDSNSKKGFMIHSPHMKSEDLDSKINELKQELGSLYKVKVFVCGASIDSSFDSEEMEALKSDRIYVSDLLGKYFKKGNIKIKWSPNDSVAELTLDTATGKFDFELDECDYADMDEMPDFDTLDDFV